ncbi:MAG: hypothetical protein M1823_006204 [Watsoniomyces obsoletus]|nr:MAG: hypothetical protein M1823_006204 [Watsoniomyces obsoletus]
MAMGQHWEGIDHLETASGNTNWSEEETHTDSPDKEGEPGRTIKIHDPRFRFRVRIRNDFVPPLHAPPPQRPRRPTRNGTPSMIVVGQIDDTAHHRNARRKGWLIRSGRRAYLRITRRRQRGDYNTWYDTQYVTEDGTRAPRNSIWFTQQFLNIGRRAFVIEAAHRHRLWYNQARRQYFGDLATWRQEQRRWEETGLASVEGRVDMPWAFPPDADGYTYTPPQSPSPDPVSSSNSSSSNPSPSPEPPPSSPPPSPSPDLPSPSEYSPSPSQNQPSQEPGQTNSSLHEYNNNDNLASWDAFVIPQQPGSTSSSSSSSESSSSSSEEEDNEEDDQQHEDDDYDQGGPPPEGDRDDDGDIYMDNYEDTVWFNQERSTVPPSPSSGYRGEGSPTLSPPQPRETPFDLGELAKSLAEQAPSDGREANDDSDSDATNKENNKVQVKPGPATWLLRTRRPPPLRRSRSSANLRRAYLAAEPSSISRILAEEWDVTARFHSLDINDRRQVEPGRERRYEQRTIDRVEPAQKTFEITNMDTNHREDQEELYD